MRPLFIIGAQKAGSSFLHNLLAQGPEVVAHPRKETHYFTSLLHNGRSYGDIFAGREEASVWLDSSTSYLHTMSAAELLHREFGSQPTVIVAIRDPIERAISAWRHSLKHGRDLRPVNRIFCVNSRNFQELFEEETAAARVGLADRSIAPRRRTVASPGDDDYLDPLFPYRYISNSFYEDLLQRYESLFDQVLIVDFSDLVRDPSGVVSRIRAKAGLRAVPLDLNVDRNSTRVACRTTLVRYARNLAVKAGFGTAMRHSLRAVPTIRKIRRDNARIASALRNEPWAIAAVDSYERLLARRI